MQRGHVLSSLHKLLHLRQQQAPPILSRPSAMMRAPLQTSVAQQGLAAAAAGRMRAPLQGPPVPPCPSVAAPAAAVAAEAAQHLAVSVGQQSCPAAFGRRGCWAGRRQKLQQAQWATTFSTKPPVGLVCVRMQRFLYWSGDVLHE